MAAIKGPDAKIKVSATDASYNDVGGMNSLDVAPGYEVADISQFGDTGKRALPTLGTFSGSASGVRDTTDAQQTIIVDAINNRTLVWIEVLPNGTAGWKAQCSVKLKVGAKQANEAVSFGFDFEAAGGAAAAAV